MLELSHQRSYQSGEKFNAGSKLQLCCLFQYPLAVKPCCLSPHLGDILYIHIYVLLQSVPNHMRKLSNPYQEHQALK